MIKAHVPQLGRFLSVGMLNGLISLLTIYGCKGFFNFGDVAANAIGYAAGLGTSFTLNSPFSMPTLKYRPSCGTRALIT